MVIEAARPARRSQPQSRGRRSSGRRSASNGMPGWVWGALGGGGALIIVLLLVLMFRDGSDADSSIASNTGNSTPVSSDPASVVATAPPLTPPAAGATPADAMAQMNALAAMPPNGGHAATPASGTVTPAGASGISNPLVATTQPMGINPNASIAPSATAPTGTAIPGAAPNSPGAGAASGSSGTISREQPYANLADLIEAVERAVVKINVVTAEGSGNGSGFVVDTEGTVITNVHVIEGATRVTGLFEGDKTEYQITDLYFADPKRDIAIVKISCPAEKLKPIGLAKEIPRKGEDLVAFGAPLGLDFTATQGIMSATRDTNDLAALGIFGQEGTWLQHSVPISPGNSGGPLVNMKGEVVAMNTMTLTIGQNLNFAISSGDITEAIGKKGSPQPLRSAPVPARPGRRGGTPQPPKDIVGTDEAKKYMGEIKTMAVIMLRLGFDPTSRITATVKNDLEDALDKAKIRVKGLQADSDAFMLVGMELEEGGGTAGTQQVTITSVCFYQKEGVVYKIWEEREKVGTVALRLFLSGEIPKNLRSGIKSFFTKFSGTVNRSRLEADRAKKAAASS